MVARPEKISDSALTMSTCTVIAIFVPTNPAVTMRGVYISFVNSVFV
jgi:hypothetical protein